MIFVYLHHQRNNKLITMKFKIGQKVKIVGLESFSGGTGYVKIGDIFTIKEYAFRAYTMEEGKVVYFFLEEDLEAIKNIETMNNNIKEHTFKQVQIELDFLFVTSYDNKEYQTKCIIEDNKFVDYGFGVDNDTYQNLCDYVRNGILAGELPIEAEYEQIDNGDHRDLCKLVYAQKLDEPNSYNYETLTFYNLDTAFAEEQIMQHYQHYQN